MPSLPITLAIIPVEGEGGREGRKEEKEGGEGGRQR